MGTSASARAGSQRPARRSMARREDDYVDGAEFDDSDELVEEQSDDSDEFQALPSLPNNAVKHALAERSSAKRKAPGPEPRASDKPREKRAALAKTSAYSWEAAYQRSWDYVQEDESGNLDHAVRRMLEVSKRKR